MKISARNKLSGTIVEVTKGATTAHVRPDDFADFHDVLECARSLSLRSALSPSPFN